MDGFLRRVLEPRLIAGRGVMWGVAAILCVPLVVLFVHDRGGSMTDSAGGLSVLPVLAAAWWLSLGPAAAVSTLAVAFRASLVAGSSISVTTGVVQSADVVVVLVLASVASRSVLERRRAATHERDTARVGEERQRRERAQREHELALLEEAARILSSTLDVAEIETQVVRSAALIWSPPGAPRWRASYLAVEGDQIRPMAEHDEAGMGIGLDHVYTLGDSALFRRVVERREAVYGRPDPAGSSPRSTAVTRASGVRTMAMAPVEVDGAVVGILAMSTRDTVDLAHGQIDRLMAVAHLAELALANARRFHQEREQVSRAMSLEAAKSRFLHLASHEMRGPLTVISGYLAMAREGDFGQLDASFEHVLGLVTGKLDELARLVDQMLETARLEDQRLALALEDVDLRGVVEATLRTLGIQVQQTHRLAVDLPEKPVMVRGDAERLLTVVGNLVDNARKYSPAGTTVLVVCRVVDDRGLVEVVDQGQGIGGSDMDTLFTRFGRIVNRENSHIPGTGLGLWLSREIARLHGGDISVRTAAGEGSTFSLSVPMAAAVAAGPTASAPPESRLRRR